MFWDRGHEEKSQDSHREREPHPTLSTNADE
jgi:hypothetical protein